MYVVSVWDKNGNCVSAHDELTLDQAHGMILENQEHPWGWTYKVEKMK